jgi:hypothetical protein
LAADAVLVTESEMSRIGASVAYAVEQSFNMLLISGARQGQNAIASAQIGEAEVNNR